MPRYLVERTFSQGLLVPPGPDGRRLVLSIVACNSDRNVTWLHSYVSTDGIKVFCMYEAPSPEAIRLTGQANGLPIDRITEVSLLDPFGYQADRTQPH